MALFIQSSLLISTPLAERLEIPLSMVLLHIFSLPLASSNLAAVIQISRSVGMCSRALFNTFLAFSYVSKRAKANQSSVEVGQHSTARPSIILASSGSSNSTASFHNRTELGICSRALRKTRFLALFSVSKSAALIHNFTALG